MNLYLKRKQTKGYKLLKMLEGLLRTYNISQGNYNEFLDLIKRYETDKDCGIKGDNKKEMGYRDECARL